MSHKSLSSTGEAVDLRTNKAELKTAKKHVK